MRLNLKENQILRIVLYECNFLRSLYSTNNEMNSFLKNSLIHSQTLRMDIVLIRVL